MASLYIEELASMPDDSRGNVIPVPGDQVTTQKVTYTGTSAQSAAFNGRTRFIGITSDGIFSFAIGADPTATTSHFRVPADVVLYRKVHPGDKIAAIVNT